MSRLLPTPDQSVDLGALLLLSLAALAGLATTYTGPAFFVVGAVGVTLGLLVGHVTTALRWPVVSAAVIAMLVFYLFGGALCLRADAGASAYLPGPTTVRDLTDQVLFGWKDLLTTLPPVDRGGPLLVLPWVLGLLAGVLGGTLALRTRPAALPLTAPLLLLAAVLLLGTREPQSLLLQGAVFAVLALAWLTIRARRAVEQVSGRQAGRLTRLVLGTGLLGLAGAGAVPAAHLAFADTGDRVVLRAFVEPPFDVGQYPSPLAAFRRYVKDPDADSTNVYDRPMLTVAGAPTGTRIRIAALDAYDGVVWGAANDATPGSSTDTFQRVSATIDNPVEGRPVDVTVEVEEGYSGVWLPTIGALQSMDFRTGEPDAKQDSFRYNLASATAVVPSGVNPGDGYAFRAVVPDDTVTPADSSSGLVSAAAYESAGFLDTQATQWTAGESDPMKRVFAAADHLRIEGKYSDGVTESEKIYHAGHNVQRLLDEFVNYPIMAGDDEQYAAVMALLANRIGVPARVVLGAVLPEDGVVRGQDISAWVELQVGDGTWRTLPTSAFMDEDKPADLPPQQERQMSGINVPPPAAIAPPSSVGDQTDAELHSRKSRRDSGDPVASLSAWLRVLALYVGLPLAALLLVVAAISGAKAWRRRRRRRADRMSTRVVGAWRELLDHARDLGEEVPTRRGWTRREQAAYLSSEAARPLAERADALVFGPTAPDAADADGFWTAVDAERASMSTGVGRKRRLAALVNLTTFRRRSRPGPRRPVRPTTTGLICEGRGSRRARPRTRAVRLGFPPRSH